MSAEFENKRKDDVESLFRIRRDSNRRESQQQSHEALTSLVLGKVPTANLLCTRFLLIFTSNDAETKSTT